MAKPAARKKDETSMLKSIGGRDQAPPAPAAEPSAEAPGKGVAIGWMGYVGGALWATVLCGAGAAAVLIAFGGK